MEELNGFPGARMILNPSGCAFYQFEIQHDEWNLFVQPAHKQGDYHEDFCNKVYIQKTNANSNGKARLLSRLRHLFTNVSIHKTIIGPNYC